MEAPRQQAPLFVAIFVRPRNRPCPPIHRALTSAFTNRSSTSSTSSTSSNSLGAATGAPAPSGRPTPPTPTAQPRLRPEWASALSRCSRRCAFAAHRGHTPRRRWQRRPRRRAARWPRGRGGCRGRRGSNSSNSSNVEAQTGEEVRPCCCCCCCCCCCFFSPFFVCSDALSLYCAEYVCWFTDRSRSLPNLPTCMYDARRLVKR